MTDVEGTFHAKTTRDFTVAVFVVHEGRVLLHLHRKLGKWLPPGGHIEPDELPDEAALREVEEESGLVVELVGQHGILDNYPDDTVQLVVPAGIQLERITLGHEHIDLVYFARVRDRSSLATVRVTEGFRWFALDDLDSIPVTGEVRGWCDRAICELAV